MPERKRFFTIDVFPNLSRPLLVRSLARCVSMRLHRDNDTGVRRNSLAVEAFLAQGDVVVHAATVVARHALEKVP